MQLLNQLNDVYNIKVEVSSAMGLHRLKSVSVQVSEKHHRSLAWTCREVCRT